MTSLGSYLVGSIFGVSLLTSSCVVMAQPNSEAQALCIAATEDAIPDALARTPDTSRPFLIQDKRFPGRGYRQAQYPDYEVTKQILSAVYHECMRGTYEMP